MMTVRIIDKGGPNLTLGNAESGFRQERSFRVLSDNYEACDESHIQTIVSDLKFIRYET